MPVVSTDFSYFVMASGHEPTSYAEVTNKVNGSVDDNGDRPGYTNVSFSITRRKVQVCYLLQSRSRTKRPTNVLSFYKATCLFSS